MAKQYSEITDRLRTIIEAQKMFTVATAASDGRVNVSPKGLDSLRILTPKRVIWLNVTGSGNETAAHVLENPRMTLMFCTFEGAPTILRLYGTARAVHPSDPEWEELSLMLPALPGARQIFDVQIDMAQTSCGMAVPLYDYQGQRDALNHWAEQKGEAGIRDYWQEKNVLSIDDKPTGITAALKSSSDENEAAGGR